MIPIRSLQTGRANRLCFAFVATCFSFASVSTAQEASKALTASLPTEDQRSPAAAFEITLAPTADDASIVRLTIEATIADKWHIYPSMKAGLNTPTEIRFEPIGLEAVGKDFKLERSGYGKELKGTFSWTRDYKASKDATSFSGSGSIRFQACDATKCLPPQTLNFVLGSEDDSAASKEQADSTDDKGIKLTTQECSTTRPPAKFSMSSMFSGRRDDVLNRKCSIESAQSMWMGKRSISICPKRRNTRSKILALTTR